MHALVHLVPINPAAGHCQPTPPQTPDIHGQVWVNLLWGHCSFFLGPGAHKLLFVPSKSLFLYPEPLPLQQSTGDPHLCRRHSTQFWLSLCGNSGSWCAQGLIEPFECLWWVWGLILNVISPLLPSYLGFAFALEHGV